MNKNALKNIIGSSLGALALSVSLAAAQSSPVIVELYTSQGCSSCPPADALLATLIDDPNVIPLALHVDYWDYIGWKDTFADAAFTARQRRYAAHIGNRTIYTPQVVINGHEMIVGSRASALHDGIKRSTQEKSPVVLKVRRDGGRLFVQAESSKPLAENVSIQIVRYLPESEVAIKRGENAGRHITYHNIVRSWQSVGQWTGKEPLDLQLDITGPEPVVVILQNLGPGEIVAAQRVQ